MRIRRTNALVNLLDLHGEWLVLEKRPAHHFVGLLEKECVPSAALGSQICWEDAAVVPFAYDPLEWVHAFLLNREC